MQARKLNIDGVGIQIEDHGGPGEAVAFIHYGGANLRMWDRAIPTFKDDYRCIAVDLRGHGQSDAPQTGYHIDDMAGDLIGVLDALEIETVHVIGSSIGAEVGLSLAANYPDRIASLIAEGALCSEYGPFGIHEVASLAEDPDTQARLDKRLETPERTYDSPEQYVEESSAFFKQYDMWNPTVESVLAYGALEREDGAVVSAWRKHASDAYMSRYFTYRFEDYYKRITCPILMLPDEDDTKDEKLLDIMLRLSELADQCEIAYAPGAMHPFGWMVNPDPMVDAAITFLNDVTGG